MKRIGLLGWLFLVALVLSSCSQVAPPPTPTELARAASSSDYLIDFQTAPVNQILYSVNTKRGVVYKGSGAANPNNILVLGKRRLGYGGIILPGHLSKVIEVYGSKRLTVVNNKTSTTPHSLGGRIKIEFAPKFNASGATVASFKVSNITASSSYVQIYNVDGSTRRVYIPKGAAGQTQTVVLNAAGVRALDFYAPTAYAVDDVVFDPGGGTSPSTCSAALSSSSAFPGDTLTVTGIPEAWTEVYGQVTTPIELSGGKIPVAKNGQNPKIFDFVVPLNPMKVTTDSQLSISFTNGQTNCAPVSLTVRSATSKPNVNGSTTKTISTFAAYIDEALTAEGKDRQAFSDPETLPTTLQFAYILYLIAEDPTNPNSLKNILARGSLMHDGASVPIDSGTLDFLVQSMGLSQLLESLQNDTSLASTHDNQRLSSAAVSDIDIDTVDDLVALLNYGPFMKSGELVASTVGIVVAGAAPVLALCSATVIGAPLCAPLLIATVEIGVSALQIAITTKIAATTVPQDYDFEFSLTKQDFNEDSAETGYLTNLRVKPGDSEAISVGDIVNGVIGDLLGRIQLKWAGDVTQKFGELITIAITERLPTFGPDVVPAISWPAFTVPKSDIAKYFALSIIGEAIAVDRTDYSFTAIQPSGASIDLDANLGGIARGYSQDVRVNAIQIKVTPTSASAEVGKATCFTAEVLNADDTGVEWSANPQEGQANGNQYCWTPRNPTAPPPGEEPSMPATSILVTAASKSRPERTGSASASVEATGSESFEVRYGAGLTIDGTYEPPQEIRTYFLETSDESYDVGFISFQNIDSQLFCNEYGSAWKLTQSEQQVSEAKSSRGTSAELTVGIDLNSNGFEITESAQVTAVYYPVLDYVDLGRAEVRLSPSVDSRGRHGLFVRSSMTINRPRQLQINWSEELSDARIESDPPFVAVLNCDSGGSNQSISPDNQNSSSQSFSLAPGSYQILVSPGELFVRTFGRSEQESALLNASLERSIKVSLQD